ncbi:MAG: helicase [Cressdnaviricota sp.]|nr:MAG: helicase [Cressdnaviricota sp.]
MTKSRLFVVTNFNCDEDILKNLVVEGKLRFIAYGKEKCPTTGKDHFQQYVMFHNQRSVSGKSLNKIGNMFGPVHCNVEPMMGSLSSNAVYCSKEGELVKLGDEPKQGSRADLKDVLARIGSGETTVEDICLDDPSFYHQYGRTLTKAEDIMRRRMHRTEMTKGIWYYGETGAGKSHAAFEGYDPLTHYVKPVLDEWWDGYTGQETVIVNDFRGQIPFSEMLNLVDKWPHYVKRRCREPTPFLAKRLIVTSSMAPCEVYSGVTQDADSLAQLDRRFEVIKVAQKCPEGNNEPLGQKRKRAD